MSHTQTQIAYGTTAQINAYVLLVDEIVHNTDTGALHIGDGVTAGGGWVIPALIGSAGYTTSTPTNGGTTTTVSKERKRIFQHTGTIAGHTLVLPPSPFDGMIFELFVRSAITTLTINAGTGGATVIQNSLSPIAGALMRWNYVNSGSDNRWYGGRY